MGSKQAESTGAAGVSPSLLAERIRDAAHPLANTEGSYDALIESIGSARFVLLGEASHGTHEFYRARAVLTERLIREKGFCAVAVEADWPDAIEVNNYVQGRCGGSARQALDTFRRFPRWMWRNSDVVRLVEALRRLNDEREPARRVGFYGLDLYSLHESMEAVVEYLEKVDPKAAQLARQRYGCFGDPNRDPQEYGMEAAYGIRQDCEEDVVKQLTEIRQKAWEYAHRDGHVAEDNYFFAEQNARLVQNAERYYRAMYHGQEDTWNLRDTHMADTLDELARHLARRFPEPKVIVWAHNSHLGDARATEMGRERGELNIGQLARERHGLQCFNVGFTTYEGTVAAASNWGAPPQKKDVRPGLAGSYERLLHDVGIPAFFLLFREKPELAELLRSDRLERAIGVIYRPETERRSHYFDASLSRQFDAVIHFDRTRAVNPLDPPTAWQQDDEPETFPSGL